MTYYYEHVNGTVHRKPDIVVDMGGGPHSYFSGPYVKRWWYEEARPTNGKPTEIEAPND